MSSESVYARWLDYPGEQLVSVVEVEIGGQRIDRQYGDWMHIWNQLTLTSEQEVCYNKMVGHTTQLTYITDPSFAQVDGPCESVAPKQVCAPRNALPETTLYVPLLFWFCRNPGLALPLIALQYHEVKVNITFEADGTDAALQSAALWVDYIYLDTDERRRFAQVSHEYLIEQLQFTGCVESKSSGQHRLNFNHPVKELVWVENAGGGAVWNVWDKVGNCKLQLNGHDRFAERDGNYFALVQPYQHHTNIPLNVAGTASANINVYSFALKPEDHQPSGTCNMSRIDNAQLNVAGDVAGGGAASLCIFAINYNVLRIMGGMGGLAYSN